jgi:hypothetical protein
MKCFDTTLAMACMPVALLKFPCPVNINLGSMHLGIQDYRYWSNAFRNSVRLS